MNLRHYLSATALLLAITAAPAAATTIEYEINFGGGSGAPSGSFTYNNVTDTFTNFTVTYLGNVFNLTSSANNPIINGTGGSCVGGATGAAAAFALFQAACLGGDESVDTVWFPISTTAFAFTNEYLSSSNYTCVEQGDATCMAPAGMPGGPIDGIDPIPEPSSWALVLVGSGLGFVMRKRLVWLREALSVRRSA
jgi:hypothetical protein